MTCAAGLSDYEEPEERVAENAPGVEAKPSPSSTRTAPDYPLSLSTTDRKNITYQLGSCIAQVLRRPVKMLVLADDMTGALEVGAKFACESIGAMVTPELSLSPPHLGDDVEVLAIDMDSRHLSPSDAGRRVRILSSLAQRRGIRYLYKKTDSTLRGNIGRELESLSSTFGGLPVIYVPAYPELGRTVERGDLLIRGRPVSDTEFAWDALNPIHESHIPTLLASQCSMPIFSHSLLSPHPEIVAGIHVCDGAADEDILACARLFLDSGTLRLAAGPAAFAHGIARLADWHRKQPARLPLIRRCLIVNGSRKDVSIRQIDHALACGYSSIAPSEAQLESRRDSWLILMLQVDATARPLQIARQTGEAVRYILDRAKIDALLVIGGDTARAVIRTLGSSSLHPLGEVMPGVPLSRMKRPGAQDLYLITKAGGFGPVDTITEIGRRLQRKD